MKICSLIIIAHLIFANINAQSVEILFDTTTQESRPNNFKYYSRTDFTKADTINLWRYDLKITSIERNNNPSAALGQITFWRKTGIDDKISHGIYGYYWTPHILFEIYRLTDSAFCREQSNRTRFFSSCVPPNVGGDIIKIGNFIFISRGVCLNCERHDIQVDYCRPIINYILSKVDLKNVTTLESLIKQLIIREEQFVVKQR